MDGRRALPVRRDAEAIRARWHEPGLRAAILEESPCRRRRSRSARGPRPGPHGDDPPRAVVAADHRARDAGSATGRSSRRRIGARPTYQRQSASASLGKSLAFATVRHTAAVGRGGAALLPRARSAGVSFNAHDDRTLATEVPGRPLVCDERWPAIQAPSRASAVCARVARPVAGRPRHASPGTSRSRRPQARRRSRARRLRRGAAPLLERASAPRRSAPMSTAEALRSSMPAVRNSSRSPGRSDNCCTP
jgi:hypothetical protein